MQIIDSQIKRNRKKERELTSKTAILTVMTNQLFRIPRSPYFQTDEYRVLEDDPVDHDLPFLTCYTKRPNQYQRRTTHKKYKAGLIKVSSFKCRIDLSRVPPPEPLEPLDCGDGDSGDRITGNDEVRETKDSASQEREIYDDYFSVLPREVLLEIVKHLYAVDVVRLSQSCRRLRRICYDNYLWRYTLFYKHQ